MTPAKLECRSCGTEIPVDGDAVACPNPDCDRTYEGLAGLGGSGGRPSSRGGRLEEDVQLEIVQEMESLGFHVSTLDQGYRGDRSTRQTPGIPDLYLMHPQWELALWVEVKGEKTPVQKSQEAWHAIAGASGVNVTIARSTGDVVEYLRELGAPIQTD